MHLEVRVVVRWIRLLWIHIEGFFNLKLIRYAETQRYELKIPGTARREFPQRNAGDPRGAEPFPHSLSQGTLSTPYLKAPSISSKFGVATQLLDLAENFLYLVR